MNGSIEETRCLTPAQTGILFMDRLPEVSGFSNLVTELDIEGQLVVEALDAAFRSLFSRHALLRSEVVEHFGEWCWRELPVPCRPVRVVDLVALGADTAVQAICDTLAEHERQWIFGMAEGWLRVILCRTSDTGWRLILNRHHVASDGWSFALISREIEEAYNAQVRGIPLLSGTAPQYWDYCQYAARQGRDATAVNYWLGKLADAPREVRFDRPTTAIPIAERAAVADLEVPLDFARRLRSCRVTAFAALLATFALVLCRRTGQTDLPVGTDVTTRDRPQWERVVGLFVNRVVLRIEVTAGSTVLEFIQSVQRTVSDAVTYRHVPIASLARQLRTSGSGTPLFNVIFGLHNNPHHPMHLAGLRAASRPLRSVPSELDLNLYFTNHTAGFTGALAYRESLFEREWATGFSEEYSDLAAHLPDSLQWRVAAALDWLEDRHGVLALARRWEAFQQERAGVR